MRILFLGGNMSKGLADWLAEHSFELGFVRQDNLKQRFIRAAEHYGAYNYPNPAIPDGPAGKL